MRLLRGTGPTGLAGIPAVRYGSIIRPLLGLDRDEILEYLRDRKLSWRTDDSNRDERILRNKIRRKLGPYLEKNFTPAISRSLARLASTSRDEDDFLEEKARAAASRAITEKAGVSFLDSSALKRFPPALARRVVRIFLRRLKGDLLDISFDDVEAVRGMADGGELPISKSLVLERRRNRIGRRSGRAASVRYARPWNGRGRLPVPEAGWTYSGRFVGAPAVRSLLESVSVGGTRRKRRVPDNAAGCFLDAARLEFPLLVRNRRPGDRYRPLGAPGGKKLKEIFRAKGVAEEERDRRPVFISGGEVVWVQGLPAAEDHKITFRTQKALAISAAPSRKRSPEKDNHGGEKK
jgi:tRNA(Ile)-lysidine synthase